MENAAIIILNYNGAEDTIECVHSIISSKCSADIIVVDNASTDDSLQRMQECLPKNVEMLVSDVNLGYAGGNNIGIQYAYKKGYDFFCVLNNDTVITEDFLSECLIALRENKDIAFVGPTIVNYTDGKIQSTGGNIYINKARVDCKNNGNEYVRTSEMIESGYIGGACMAFCREIIDQIGVIPESYFLFFEETEWCYAALRAGYRNVCLKSTKIQHKGSISIQKIGGLNEYLMARNRIAFLRRNHPSKFVAFMIYIVLCAKAVVSSCLGNSANSALVKYYSHGWFKKVDLDRFPFIKIIE